MEGTEDKGSNPLSILVDGGQWPQAALFTGQLWVDAGKRFFLWKWAVLLWRQRGSETPVLGGSQRLAGPSRGQPDPWRLPFLAEQEPGLENHGGPRWPILLQLFSHAEGGGWELKACQERARNLGNGTGEETQGS